MNLYSFLLFILILLLILSAILIATSSFLLSYDNKKIKGGADTDDESSISSLGFNSTSPNDPLEDFSFTPLVIDNFSSPNPSTIANFDQIYANRTGEPFSSDPSTIANFDQFSKNNRSLLENVKKVRIGPIFQSSREKEKKFKRPNYKELLKISDSKSVNIIDRYYDNKNFRSELGKLRIQKKQQQHSGHLE